MKDDDVTDIARMLGRIEATVEAQGKTHSIKIDALTGSVQHLQNTVMQHAKLIAEVKEDARANAEALSSYQSNEAHKEGALIKHFSVMKNELDRLQGSTIAQNTVLASQSSELGTQTTMLKGLKRFEFLTPIATAIIAAVGVIFAAYFSARGH